MKKLIEVIKGDIDRARINGPCPVRRAIARAFKKGRDNFSVGMTQANIGNKSGVPLPMQVRKFISDFDNGLIVNPFTFELEY